MTAIPLTARVLYLLCALVFAASMTAVAAGVKACVPVIAYYPEEYRCWWWCCVVLAAVAWWVMRWMHKRYEME
jgi:hypothetical protein